MVEKIKEALDRAYQERAGVSNPQVGRSVTASVTGAPIGVSIKSILKNAKIHDVDTKKLAQNRIITYDNSDDAVERYRLLRTQLIGRMQTDQLTTIGITSPNANEGKTLTSINLAISLAKTADIDVILVDGDITHPSLHKVLGIESKNGFVDLVKNDIDLSGAILKLSIPNLWLIPGRYEELSLLDQTNPNQVEEMIQDLTFADRNLIIFDLPPVLSKDDTLAIAACLDGVILVVQEGTTKSTEITRSVELLKQGNLIGTVMNKYSRQQMTYY